MFYIRNYNSWIEFDSVHVDTINKHRTCACIENTASQGGEEMAAWLGI